MGGCGHVFMSMCGFIQMYTSSQCEYRQNSFFNTSLTSGSSLVTSIRTNIDKMTCPGNSCSICISELPANANNFLISITAGNQFASIAATSDVQIMSK